MNAGVWAAAGVPIAQGAFEANTPIRDTGNGVEGDIGANVGFGGAGIGFGVYAVGSYTSIIFNGTYEETLNKLANYINFNVYETD